MRVVYLGTPETAVPPLRKLLEHSCEVCGVFTQPDRPTGRGHKRKPGPVKVFALEKGIPVYQPEKIRDDESREILDSLSPDFLVTAAYGQILPGRLLKAARIAPLNIHFSLLPRFRGAAPVAHAILNGDSVTGITIMVMQEGLDAGPILLQRELPISLSATTGELESELAESGAELLIQAMEMYRNGDAHPVAQDDLLASWAPRIIRDDALIDWNETAMAIHNRIRAMNPKPGAHTLFREERLHLWRSMPESGEGVSSGAPGIFIGLDREGLRVQCGSGTVLQLLELQKPSKKRVNGREFASGVRAVPNELLFRD